MDIFEQTKKDLQEFVDKAEVFIEQQETKLNALREPPTYQKKYDVKDNLDDYSKRIIAELEKKNDKLGTDLYNAENIVSDLQSQLAESKKQCQQCKHLNKKIELNIKNKLMSELAEKDREIERLKQNYDEVWEDTYFSVKEDFELNNNCNECRRYYAEEFNKQLAEKEKQYQSFKKIADENVNYLKNRILEETKHYNQDKISFCIEQLEKVKWFIEDIDYEYGNDYFIDREETMKRIDNQIKQLKEGK